MFHLECVALVSTPEVLMYVQIWSILRDKFNPQCSRRRRAVPSDSTRDVCGKVECSDTLAMPVSIST
ncbi:hypothetical protein DPMN_042014 [Dreissena polymorpha]|uniref:Uncharacterized protein n=1 Tax=Dreissena polymorpha TaxID=45954 RepID=A0A9D4CYA1_DREPO|nr:hypothetical protein DPMN_042014 [Dreissena polymorpha]